MITFSKKIVPQALATDIKNDFPAVGFLARGQIRAVGTKAVFLDSEQIPDNWSALYVAIVIIEGAAPSNAQLQAYIAAHDYNTEEQAEESDKINLTKRLSKFDKAAWLSILDLLREQCGATETNGQFIQRVKTKYQSL